MTNPTTPNLRKICMDLLAYREHSRLELRNKLLLREFEPESIEPILDSLVRDNLLNDQRFAEAYTRMRARRGFGSIRIKQELNERGIANELITNAIRSTELDWWQLVAEQKQKKFGTVVAKDFPERAKQMRFLQYRGFDNEQIRFAVEMRDI
ncbi:MAG: regulatory protein RecX [Gammaproteobacteria bacterium]|nr:regulatory protein RecX [Gammaproteobacteria bacterium]